MAKVMLREDNGEIYFYIAKKDMEETITHLEFESDEQWGGEVTLSNGETWWIQPGKKNLPKEEVCKKLND
ncbi:MAG: putative nitrogen fixation protein NifT [Campylobacterales bacterium]|uniref:Putative nitrogen fixation protein FixT n=1 Tax=Sulfurospirillum barnesii (strain ATCC 700032 / DSM 10660 / SES-3) TaxID=760154 RepID=I3XWP8_SULBS|nr:putative nitrogen fixation protein NifT [Sulfurospirillum barnesii]AFL68372.1 putative nitrogen fixation protein FixT [Sulfurospirillum barnesii SES-3]MBN1840064.1 putative nitrogen fixation protein NifT [Campylobacterales bacterium]